MKTTNFLRIASILVILLIVVPTFVTAQTFDSATKANKVLGQNMISVVNIAVAAFLIIALVVTIIREIKKSLQNPESKTSRFTYWLCNTCGGASLRFFVIIAILAGMFFIGGCSKQTTLPAPESYNEKLYFQVYIHNVPEGYSVDATMYVDFYKEGQTLSGWVTDVRDSIWPNYSSGTGSCDRIGARYEAQLSLNLINEKKERFECSVYPLWIVGFMEQNQEFHFTFNGFKQQ